MCVTDFKQTSIKIHLIDNTCELQFRWSVARVQPTFLKDRAGAETKAAQETHWMESLCIFAGVHLSVYSFLI